MSTAHKPWLHRLPRIRPTLLLLALLAAAGSAQAADEAASHADPQAVSQDLARRVCVACHGPGGHASSPLFPHLAGQPAAYLAGELRAFRSHQRDDREARDYMWGIARMLDDRTIDALAEYYAQQSPGSAAALSASQLSAGEQLFARGDPQRGIPACVSCHGDHGEGRDSFPRIAGQQDSYVRHQLREMRVGDRPAPVMKNVLAGMDDAEIDAVASFLAAQR